MKSTLIGHVARRALRLALQRVLPDLPSFEAGGGPVIPQAVVVRQAPAGDLEVLLVKRTSPRAWELPGGYVDPGEAPDAALRREVREETGLEVSLDRLVGWYHRTGFRPHRSPVYACTPAGGHLRRSHEAVDIGYFRIAKLPLGLFPWYRQVIRDATGGVTLSGAKTQHLGLVAVASGATIHVAARLGLLR
ncbi:MAG: NUDIX domain-containing protein [Chloroflexota bacterium]|nr:NUDIX domain-containing protein [Chloroflexota bacterium]